MRRICLLALRQHNCIPELRLGQGVKKVQRFTLKGNFFFCALPCIHHIYKLNGHLHSTYWSSRNADIDGMSEMLLFDAATDCVETASDTECKTSLTLSSLAWLEMEMLSLSPQLLLLTPHTVLWKIVTITDACNRWSDPRLMSLMVQYDCLYFTYWPAEGKGLCCMW